MSGEDPINGVSHFVVPDREAERPKSTSQWVEAIKASMPDVWMPAVYRDEILKLRTRAHRLDIPTKENRVEILHTLLGVELKVGRKRILCPDLATARYLSAFARAGCANIGIPYDITLISHLADRLESSWHRMLLLADHAAYGRSVAFRSHVRSALIRDVRKEIDLAGPGTAIPKFVQNTRQRRA